MPRYTGEFSGPCPACDEHIEFALGIRTDGPPAAMHFGPGGPTPVAVRDVQLMLMVDDRLDVAFRFDCPLCGAGGAGRATCSAVPSPE